ncbi:MAG: hypothetical protein ABR588_05920 [Sphingomicrobium sp.]|nr:hypothetical protein [Sphingomonadales bacterium]
MTITQQAKGGASAPSNVVRLPTAARRQVKQACNKAGRAARAALRAEQPWPGEYLFPGIRDAMRRLRGLRSMPSSAAVNLARSVVDPETINERPRVLGLIRCGVDAGDPFAREVHRLLRELTGTTYGDHNDFKNALTRLAMAREAL